MEWQDEEPERTKAAPRLLPKRYPGRFSTYFSLSFAVSPIALTACCVYFMGFGAMFLATVAEKERAIPTTYVVVAGIFYLAVCVFVCASVNAVLWPMARGGAVVLGWFRKEREACEAQQQECFIVEMITRPPVARRPFLARLMDDADDVGLIRVTPEQIAYTGEACTWTIDQSEVARVRYRSVGYRGLWLWKRLELTLAQPIDGVETITLGLREGATLMSFNARLHELHAALSGFEANVVSRETGNPYQSPGYY